MDAKVIKAKPQSEYWSDERCHILEFSNTSDDAEVSIARARVEPGVTTKRHRVRGTIERYLIMEGRGTVHIEGLADQNVSPGDVVLIPAGAIQAIANSGDCDLVFLCICTPRFEWDNYESLS